LYLKETWLKRAKELRGLLLGNHDTLYHDFKGLNYLTDLFTIFEMRSSSTLIIKVTVVTLVDNLHFASYLSALQNTNQQQPYSIRKIM